MRSKVPDTIAKTDFRYFVVRFEKLTEGLFLVKANIMNRKNIFLFKTDKMASTWSSEDSILSTSEDIFLKVFEV